MQKIYTNKNGVQFNLCRYSDTLYIANDIETGRTYFIDASEVDCYVSSADIIDMIMLDSCCTYNQACVSCPKYKSHCGVHTKLIALDMLLKYGGDCI